MMRWLPFLKNMSRAAGKGDFFPTRLPPGEAPGGSTQPLLRGDILTRLQHERSWFRFTQHTLPLRDLQTPLSILHLTDVHLRDNDAALDEMCHQMSQARPDLVVLTGDVVTRGWQKDAVNRFLSALPQAPLGRFAIMGNWEYWSGADLEQWRAILAGHGVTLLHEAWQDLGAITLAGTDDLLAGNPDPDTLLASLPRERPAVVLSHSPAMFPRLASPPVQLVLSGPSHGGQVCIPGLGAVWAPRGTGPYLAGWFEENGSHLFVSRGLGWSVAPIRLHCPPELAWINLIPAPAAAS